MRDAPERAHRTTEPTDVDAAPNGMSWLPQEVVGGVQRCACRRGSSSCVKHETLPPDDSVSCNVRFFAGLATAASVLAARRRLVTTSGDQMLATVHNGPRLPSKAWLRRNTRAGTGPYNGAA